MITALKKKFAGPIAENTSNPTSTPPNSLARQSNKSVFPSPSNSSKHRAAGDRKSPMATPAGVNVVSAELQKKFAHGVNFNMKVIIRGDRNSGKTSLWRRLQGLPFDEHYCPTQEIQVANITWNYRTFDHIVKLDIWDVVDEGVKKRQPNQFLKLENNPSADGCSSSFEMLENAACDASIVDVYKNCNGVLLLFDVTKAWTWGYVQRELAKIPSQTPVLIMANKIDLQPDRQVREHECLAFLQTFERKPNTNGRIIAPIRYSQCSMKNAQGLKFLYNFFNVPFLFLQREYLETALEANTRDLEIAQEELDLYQDNGASKNFTHKAAQNTEGSVLDDGTNIEQEDTKESYSLQPKKPLFHESTQFSKQMASKDTSKNKDISVARKFSSASNSSEDDNKMVDMYEEDFDSNEEMQCESRQCAVSQPASSLPKREQRSPGLSLGDLNLKENSKRTVPLESPSSQLDAWFSSANTPTEEVDKPKNWSSAEHARLEAENSTGRNPLVAYFSDNDINSASDQEMSDETPSNACTVESSTSCSTTGFTHIVSPTTKNKKSKQLVSSTSTLTSISVSKEATIGVKPNTKKAANNDATNSKKKRKMEGKKTRKFVTEDIPSSNLLSEDLDFPVDRPNSYEMYDPL